MEIFFLWDAIKFFVLAERRYLAALHLQRLSMKNENWLRSQYLHNHESQHTTRNQFNLFEVHYLFPAYVIMLGYSQTGTSILCGTLFSCIDSLIHETARRRPVQVTHDKLGNSPIPNYPLFHEYLYNTPFHVTTPHPMAIWMDNPECFVILQLHGEQETAAANSSDNAGNTGSEVLKWLILGVNRL